MSWIRAITVRGVRHIARWDVALEPRAAGPRHAVLVGPCGSGKSSVLAEIAREIEATLDGDPHPSRGLDGAAERDVRLAYFGRPLRLDWTRADAVAGEFVAGRWVCAALEARRAPLAVTGEAAAGEPVSTRPTTRVAGRLGELLVRREAERRLAQQRGDARQLARLSAWREDVREWLAELLHDAALQLVIGERDVALDFADGRRLPLEALSIGHAGAVSVWAELFLRAEAARRRNEDPGYDPRGVLVIDAAEAFLDPRLQRALLPLLVRAFPGVQIVASTSSPIVASSLPDATLLDLASRSTRRAPSLPPPAALPPPPRASPRPPGPPAPPRGDPEQTGPLGPPTLPSPAPAVSPSPSAGSSSAESPPPDDEATRPSVPLPPSRLPPPPSRRPPPPPSRRPPPPPSRRPPSPPSVRPSAPPSGGPPPPPPPSRRGPPPPSVRPPSPPGRPPLRPPPPSPWVDEAPRATPPEPSRPRPPAGGPPPGPRPAVADGASSEPTDTTPPNRPTWTGAGPWADRTEPEGPEGSSG